MIDYLPTILVVGSLGVSLYVLWLVGSLQRQVNDLMDLLGLIALKMSVDDALMRHATRKHEMEDQDIDYSSYD